MDISVKKELGCQRQSDTGEFARLLSLNACSKKLKYGAKPPEAKTPQFLERPVIELLTAAGVRNPDDRPMRLLPLLPSNLG